MFCKRCDQGEIRRAIVKSSQKEIYICDECDAVWPTLQAAQDLALFRDFSEFMKDNGDVGLWTEITILE